MFKIKIIFMYFKNFVLFILQCYVSIAAILSFFFCGNFYAFINKNFSILDYYD